MPDVLDGTSAVSADGPPHRRTFQAAAGVGALAVAEAAPLARAATGRTPVRVATAVLNGRVFTAARDGAPAQAVTVGSDGEILTVCGNTDIRRRFGPHAVIIGADDGTVMPGIRDGHMHPLGAGRAVENQPPPTRREGLIRSQSVAGHAHRGRGETSA
ncbi:hypothetical protein [Streptomyces sp. NBC_01314]|uniref:hypothetical protein n=1 Tax=Streptomyces sp. NBC_01314 TaxID=2903821 RepID=UPI0030849DD0|nr:hypothetical protein OG622_48910 [Streptomyces sp. NBC_01314]